MILLTSSAGPIPVKLTQGVNRLTRPCRGTSPACVFCPRCARGRARARGSRASPRHRGVGNATGQDLARRATTDCASRFGGRGIAPSSPTIPPPPPSPPPPLPPPHPPPSPLT